MVAEVVSVGLGIVVVADVVIDALLGAVVEDNVACGALSIDRIVLSPLWWLLLLLVVILLLLLLLVGVVTDESNGFVVFCKVGGRGEAESLSYAKEGG